VATAARLCLLGTALAWPLAALPAAQTDGSVGAVQSLTGHFIVPQSLGTVRGANLFHSFARFGVGTGESATFTTTDAGLRHVISRVTGGEASLIDGTLRLDAAAGSRPAFWFINPSGLTVGAGAVIDVPASLHLATAAQLQFGDGLVWDARDGRGSTLSIAAPERFGFVGDQAAAALRWQGASTTLQPGQLLELAAGSIRIDGATLFAPGGGIRLQAPGDVSITEAALYASTGSAAASGNIRIDAGALTIDARGQAASLGVETAAGQVARAAAIELQVAGPLQILGGADISSYNTSDQAAGRVHIRADTITADGLSQRATGIASYAYGSGTGAAIDVESSGALTLLGGAQIFTAGAGAGDSGKLTLRAGSLLMDGHGTFAYIGTQVLDGGSGAAGALDLQVRDAVQMRAGAQIDSAIGGSGRPGPLSLSAGSLQVDGQGSGLITGLFNYGAAALQVDVDGHLDLRGGGGISSFSRAGLAPAGLSVQARSITLDGGGNTVANIGSLSSTTSPAAAVRVQALERLLLTRGGQIDSSTLGSGDAGTVQVVAPEIEMSGGGEFVTLIASSSFGRQGGNSGGVDVQASRLSLGNAASISADTLADNGRAGNISVQADSITIDGGGLTTGIRALGLGTASSAGSVTLVARQQLTIRDGGSIIVGTLGSGNPGSITVRAPTLLIDGQGALDTYTGIAGDTFPDAADGQGAGAAVAIEAGQITVRSGGSISSSTYGASDAGSVSISADVLNVDGDNRSRATGISADSNGAGNAGSVAIKARDVTISNGALVSTSTLSTGRGGPIHIDAANLTVENSALIASLTAGPGAAGDIDLQVSQALVLRHGGAISANTDGTGAGGHIRIRAGSFLGTGVDPETDFRSLLVSRARPASGGVPGNITLDIQGSFVLQDGAALSIANDAQVANAAVLPAGTISVSAGAIELCRGEITAAASGNANAGQIVLSSASRVTLDDSSVRTSSVDGDGGPITVSAAGLVRLRDSRITSSVDGSSAGNGGDIRITGQGLLLQSGFVQANTLAPRARGGDVQVAVGLLVPDGSHVVLGGSRIEDFRPGVPGLNVIQAAAPEGLSGTLAVTLPQLNLSGSLAGLATPRIDFGPLGRDLCDVSGASSFSVQGRGALTEPAAGPLRIRP
jgi:filamentous hemagglutinin family protein